MEEREGRGDKHTHTLSCTHTHTAPVTNSLSDGERNFRRNQERRNCCSSASSFSSSASSYDAGKSEMNHSVEFESINSYKLGCWK